MKLQSKINKYHLIIAVIEIILVGTTISLLSSELPRYRRPERLLFMKEKVLEQARDKEILPIEGLINIEELHDQNYKMPEQLGDTTIYDPVEKENAPFLQLKFTTLLNGKNYRITLYQPLYERVTPTRRITIGLVAVFIFLTILLYSLPNRTIKKIWLPFYATLDSLKSYRLAQESSIQLKPTVIDEFSELNNTINILTERVRKDYLNLKEFTEDASHEMQTPIAVIRSKIELLFQDENLNEEQTKLLHEIDEASGRLSRLIQSLLLLAKIENMQFVDSAEININLLVEKQLLELDELLQMKNISLEKNLAQPLTIKMNPALADILIRNLLRNASRYSSVPGKIVIYTTASGLTIANTGSPLKIPAGHIFERFKKDSASPDSLGLGLSIVKKICDIYSFKIKYSYGERFHSFNIEF